MEPVRDRYADLIRATAIWAVVLGHWLVIAVTDTDDGIDGVNVLGQLDWLHPLTWLFQVMPLFFFVGGFANAVSLSRHQRLGGDPLAWISRRYRRLVLPAAALLTTLAAVVGVAHLVGVDPDQLGTAAWLATVPLWFLAAYLTVIALTPLTFAAHQRFGFWVPGGCAILVVLADVVRFNAGEVWFVNVTYLVGWLGIHQLGYSWWDRRLPSTVPVGLLTAGIGLVVLLLLVLVGPYPVSMVSGTGAEIQNSEPPSAALLALAVTQIGLVLALRDLASRWLEAAGRGRMVARVQSVVLTLFLWHMAAALIAAATLYGTGLLAVEPVDSGRWLVQRIPWVAGCAVALTVLVAVFARIELNLRLGQRGRRFASGPFAWATGIGAIATLVGMLRIALAGSGSHGPMGLPTDALVLFAVGVSLIYLGARKPVT